MQRRTYPRFLQVEESLEEDEDFSSNQISMEPMPIEEVLRIK